MAPLHFLLVGSATLLLIAGNSRAFAMCSAEEWDDMIQSSNAVEQGAAGSGAEGDDSADAAKAVSSISTIWTWVIAHSPYDAPRACPKVEFRSAEQLTKNLCPPDTHHCSIGGYYRDGSGTVLMRDDHRLDDVRVRAMLAHELVHYFQDQSGIWHEKSCRNKILREREAYDLQQRYLFAHRGNPFGIRIPALDESLCSERIN